MKKENAGVFGKGIHDLRRENKATRKEEIKLFRDIKIYVNMY